MLRLLFAGTPDVAVPALHALAADSDNFDIAAVLTRPDAPQGRGQKLGLSPVKVAAMELGIPVLDSDPNEPVFLDVLKATGADAAAAVAYGRILKQDVLDALSLGWYNLHFSLLPQWRGAAPVQRAIWAGDNVTGTTVFRITPGMDEGPILAQSTTEIGHHETAGELLDRLAQDGSRLLVSTLKAIEDEQIQPIEQERGAFEVADKIRAEDAHLRFDVPVFALDRQIRACTPHPGAWSRLHLSTNDSDETLVLHILRARPADDGQQDAPEGLAPGVLHVGKHTVWVGTASEPLELLEVKAEGKRAMSAADWARGARLEPGAYCD